MTTKPGTRADVRVPGGAEATLLPADQAATDKEAAIVWSADKLRVATTREMAQRMNDPAAAHAAVAERMLVTLGQIEGRRALVARASSPAMTRRWVRPDRAK